MNIDDILSTIVHEGQHELDIAAKVIPLKSAATDADILLAEMRAFRAAGEFAKLNQLTKAAAFGHASEWPVELAISISRGYKLDVTDAQMWAAIHGAYR